MSIYVHLLSEAALPPEATSASGTCCYDHESYI
jgi:hypothetical protein